jgi:hypothetical protein
VHEGCVAQSAVLIGLWLAAGVWAGPAGQGQAPRAVLVSPFTPLAAFTPDGTDEVQA